MIKKILDIRHFIILFLLVACFLLQHNKPKKEIVTIFKHPEDNDYYAIIQSPYDKRSMTSSHHEIEADTLDELKNELLKNNFISSEENINNFVVDGELK
jgi:hypothetical protein